MRAVPTEMIFARFVANATSYDVERVWIMGWYRKSIGSKLVGLRALWHVAYNNMFIMEVSRARNKSWVALGNSLVKWTVVLLVSLGFFNWHIYWKQFANFLRYTPRRIFHDALEKICILSPDIVFFKKYVPQSPGLGMRSQQCWRLLVFCPLKCWQTLFWSFGFPLCFNKMCVCVYNAEE